MTDEELPVLECKEVRFAYPSRPNKPRKLAVKLVGEIGWLRIYPKQYWAIVGKTGSGKSTVIRLITRQLTPQSKESIKFAGVPLWEIPNIDLFGDPSSETLVGEHYSHARMALVPQDPSILNGTVRSNIVFNLGEEEESEGQHSAAKKAERKRMLDRQVEDAFHRAALDSLAEGLDTETGEGGKMLSGGEKQRTSTGRAIVRWPKLLLLDEPTSAQDAENEEALLETLRG